MMLLFLRATREGDWNLHLSAVRSFLPYLFVYSHVNYARYLPAYWLEMCELALTHPAVHEKFMKGRFAVQRQGDHGFSQVACDQTIEQTCNRDTKTKGGMVGFTTQKGAVTRWILSQPERAAISKRCEEMAGKDERINGRKDLQQSRVQRDEEHVCNVITVLEAMINPFEDINDQLVHIASGCVASKDVSDDYISARERGDAAFMRHCKERLHGSEDMFKTLRMEKTTTFQSMNKTTKSKVKGKEVVLKADRNLFQRLLIIANVRKLDIRNMLTYNLGPLPLSIALPDGSLNKTAKASLLHCIESHVQPSPQDDILPGSVWNIDGMAMVQEMSPRHIPTTFGKLAEYLLKQLVNLALSVRSNVIHFVVDTYRNDSIKKVERGRRSIGGSVLTKIYSEEQQVPHQWKKFLACGDNKAELIRFLFQTWRKMPSAILKNVTVFAAHDEECHEITAENGQIQERLVPELQCNHEEADTRLFLHCQYAARQQPTRVGDRAPHPILI